MTAEPEVSSVVMTTHLEEDLRLVILEDLTVPLRVVPQPLIIDNGIIVDPVLLPWIDVVGDDELCSVCLTQLVFKPSKLVGDLWP